MKNTLYTIVILILPVLLLAQAQEANLLYNWNDTTLIVNNWPGGRYNEVWGVGINDVEIGIIGSTGGTHFIDVTDPLNSHEIESAYVPGLFQGAAVIHRDYHDYNGYLYAVCDEGPSSLQIINMTQLPDTAMLVYDNDEFIVRAHNIFIDAAAARLYSTGGAGVKVLSLEDPENPILLAAFPNDKLNIPYAHDLFVRGDTAFLNCGNSGLWVVDFTDLENPAVLGTMTVYEQQGYNHAGWMHESQPYYYLEDETHGMDVKVVSVSDLNDMFVISTFNAASPAPTSIAHNVLVRGNYLYVSYYYDGVQVFDITDPENPVRAYYYDTYSEPDGNSYKGVWGVYPYLPSGNILVSDMQSGLFVFEAVDETITNIASPLLFKQNVVVWPNPAENNFTLQLDISNPGDQITVTLLGLNGKSLTTWKVTGMISGQNRVDLELTAEVPNGLYFLRIESEGFEVTKKMMVQRR